MNLKKNPTINSIFANIVDGGVSSARHPVWKIYMQILLIFPILFKYCVYLFYVFFFLLVAEFLCCIISSFHGSFHFCYTNYIQMFCRIVSVSVLYIIYDCVYGRRETSIFQFDFNLISFCICL